MNKNSNTKFPTEWENAKVCSCDKPDCKGNHRICDLCDKKILKGHFQKENTLYSWNIINCENENKVVCSQCYKSNFNELSEMLSNILSNNESSIKDNAIGNIANSYVGINSLHIKLLSQLLEQTCSFEFFRLIQEYFSCLHNNLNTAAILLSRKVLIHLAVELGYEVKKSANKEEFLDHILDYIKKCKIIGESLNNKIDVILDIVKKVNYEINPISSMDIEIVKFIIYELLRMYHISRTLNV